MVLRGVKLFRRRRESQQVGEAAARIERALALRRAGLSAFNRASLIKNGLVDERDLPVLQAALDELERRRSIGRVGPTYFLL